MGSPSAHCTSLKEWSCFAAVPKLPYGQIDLLEKPVIKGRLLRFWGTGYDEMFRISEILVLVSESETN